VIVTYEQSVRPFWAEVIQAADGFQEVRREALWHQTELEADRRDPD
jgi:hypothetical protein